MKILVASDAIWHATGYGIQTRMLCKRLVADGHTVYNYAPGAFHLGKAVVDGVTVLSSNFGDDREGNNTLAYHVMKYQPDLIITWLDCHGLLGYGMDTTPTWMWAPIDTWPVPQHELAILSRAEKVLVPSRWGQEELRKKGIEAEYVPCGIDPAVYYPDPDAGKKWRRDCGVADDDFLIGMVGMNSGSPDRKGFGFAFDAIKAFSEEHPKTKAYIHTNAEGANGAINLLELRAELGLEGVVFFSPPMGPEGAPEAYLRAAYNAMDVYLHAGGTEGFGVPVVEAQACGTPVVATAATAVTELLSGPSIPCDPLGDMIVNTSTRIAIPSVENLIRGLNTVSQFVPLRAVVQSKFAFDRIYDETWRPLLATVPAPVVVERGRRLMLGAGKEQKPGFTHHDIQKFHPHIDVAHDLTVFPYPWEDDAWDYVEMSDVIEHLRGDVTAVLDELWRVVAPDGHLFIHTAEAGSWQHRMDPTHVRGFMLNSFDYYDPETPAGRTYRYTERGWKIVKRTIDQTGGIVVVMTPRKDAVPVEERSEELEACVL